MTDQETFDTVVRHLHRQGKPAVDAFGNCVYRAPDGCRCAAGCLIPDDKYRESMEHCSADADQVGGVLLSEGHDPRLARHLQFLVHDDLENWGDGGLNARGVERLRHLAVRYGLSAAVVDELFGSTSG